MSLAYTLLTTPTFERDFKKLDADVARRIRKKTELLASHPEAVLPLLRNMPDNLKGLRKYRIGDYRVLLWLDHSNRIIKLYSVEHRSTVYRDL